MITGKVAIIIAIVWLLIITSFLFCLAILGNSTEEDKLLNDKKQEDYLIALNEAQKLKHKERNRRNNEREKNN